MGIFTEINVQHWALNHTWALNIADFTYFHAHFGITTVFLFWLYLRRNRHYYFVRNAIFVADGIALLGFTLFPTAPPRLLTYLGFTDTLDRYADINTYSEGFKQLTNPYAAIPSIHTCYSILIAVSCFFLVRWMPLRIGLAVLPGADRLLDRRHREPLLARRGAGRDHRGSVPGRRLADRERRTPTLARLGCAAAPPLAPARVTAPRNSARGIVRAMSAMLTRLKAGYTSRRTRGRDGGHGPVLRRSPSRPTRSPSPAS